jgi:hypothetical protein
MPVPVPAVPVVEVPTATEAAPVVVVAADASDDELDSELKDILGSLDNLD